MWPDQRERGNFEDLCIDGTKILKWIVNKSDGETWTGLLWLRTGTVGGALVNAATKLRVS